METGDMLVLDPMLSHSGSRFREGLPPGAPDARYVLFSLFADKCCGGACSGQVFCQHLTCS